MEFDQSAVDNEDFEGSCYFGDFFKDGRYKYDEGDEDYFFFFEKKIEIKIEYRLVNIIIRRIY